MEGLGTSASCSYLLRYTYGRWDLFGHQLSEPCLIARMQKEECPCTNTIVKDCKHEKVYLDELQRKELALKQKEKELIKKDKLLQRDITKFNNRKKNTAEKDLKAAAKLNNARMKLLLTADRKEKGQKCDRHSCKQFQKQHRRSTNSKQRKKVVEKVKRDSCTPLQYFNCLFTRTCKCVAEHTKRWSTKLQEMYDPCNFMSKNSDRCCSQCNCRQRSSCDSYCDRAAGDCAAMVRRPHQPWLNPPYLNVKQQCMNCANPLLFLGAILAWSPCLICLGLCVCCLCVCCCEQ